MGGHLKQTFNLKSIPMKHRFYESKILYILISALLCIQIGAYVVQLVNHRNIAEETLSEELTVGAQVFNRLLESRNTQLQQTAEILAKDYGFLEAISMAQQDNATIESILENHGARAKASTLILSDLDNQMIAHTPSKLAIAEDAQGAILDHLEKDAHSIHFSTLHVLGTANQSRPLFHVVKSAVRAPNHIANLIIGDAIDQEFVNDLRHVTNMEMFFISHHKQNWELHASTLPSLFTKAFTDQFNAEQAGKVTRFDIGNDAYLMLPISVSQAEGEAAFAVIAKPISQMMQPYQRAERVLSVLLVATLMLSMVAVYLVTKKMVTPLSEQAHLDNLTGLGNRRLFNLAVQDALKRLNGTGTPFALLMLDLDKFKQVNDTMGHDTGDAVLKTIADRLKKTVRTTDNIMRLGGDEFAIVLEDCSESATCVIADKISKAIAEPIEAAGEYIVLHASIGIAFAQKNTDNMDSIMKKSDEAMYISKTTQVNYWCYQEKSTEDNI